jgi:hydrophobic/amphiphilic exporter-1 (mainly G- bacteria), HAE1 family
MTLSSVAIKRPVFTVMLTFALLVLGFVGFSRLGTDLFPDVSFPIVTVTVPYPGASPKEVETLVTKQVEDEVVSLNGLDRVRSFSREGLSTTIIFFQLGVDINDAATLVRERVGRMKYKLPTEAKEPVVGRFDVGAAPILTYTVRSSQALSAIRKFADDKLKPAIEQSAGVAAVEVRGGAKREVRIRIDRAKLDALMVPTELLLQRLRAENVTVPAGHFSEGAREVSVRTVGEFSNVDQVRDLVVTTGRDGSVVRLRDVASVEDGFEEARGITRVNGQDAVTFDVLKQSGTNTVEVAHAVKKTVEGLKGKLPEGMIVEPLIDQSHFIERDVETVEHDIVFGGIMAILVILFFMLDLRSTLISSVALPTSVIGTFFVMYVLGYTLNMMTLLALSLAIGLLIDDAIVVRENITKHLERGKPAFQAALDGTEEIALSVLATTLTIVAVFLPVAFVKGIVGQFFRQFGITISVAVLISLFVAFTLDPMLSSRFSKPIDHNAVDPWLPVKRPFLAFFEGLENAYRIVLRWAVTHKALVGLMAIGSLVLMSVAAKLTGNEFVNAEDRGQYVLEVELPAGTSLQETARLTKPAEDELLQNPNITAIYARVGVNNEINKSLWRVVTTPKSERKESIFQLKEAGRLVAAKIPKANVIVTDPPFVEGAATEAPIMIAVRGVSYPDIEPAARQLAKILMNTPGVQDVQMKYSPGKPELQLDIDRAKAADRGLTVGQVAMALRTAMDGAEAGKLRDGNDDVTIRVLYAEHDRDRADALEQISIMSPKGPTKLADIATFVRADGPQVIEREARSRQIQVWAAPNGRPLGDIVKDIKPQIDAIKLPPGGSIFYDGQIRLMNENNSSMGNAMLLGVIFIYIILASQFESFVHPITIMVTLPLAFVGAILGLFLAEHTVAMGALIGLILLMGLVTKNAILLIDRAIVRVREDGETPLQAILEAGPERLRPILMTSAAMILGMLPTAIGKGEGSEFRAPMGVAVIGGVVSSTFLSLIVIPVVYLAVESIKGWLAARMGRTIVARPEAAE